MLETYRRALDMATFDALDSIDAGETATAFLHARDATRYARLLMWLDARDRRSANTSRHPAQRKPALAGRPDISPLDEIDAWPTPRATLNYALASSSWRRT